MIDILTTTAVLALLGLVFGGALAVISKRFQIEEDPLRDEVRGVLPGANCGACGYPGCDAYADAVANESVAISLCPVGGNAVMHSLGEILGIESETHEQMIAYVVCQGSSDACISRFEYEGPKDCRSAALVALGDKACSFSCLGLGNCERSCPFGAVTIRDGRLAEVDESKCVGCGICTMECPRGILRLDPKDRPVRRMCSAMARGKIVMDHCGVGCVGCGKCERSCKFGAIRMINDLPEIAYERCTGCMCCADSCPTGALAANEAMRSQALINPKDCTRCGTCMETCAFDAIMHDEKKNRYSVAAWNCTGCEKCAIQCPSGAIQLRRVAQIRR